MDSSGMSVKMSRVRAVLFVLTVWATSFTVMWQMSELVIVNDLYEAFPEQVGMAIISEVFLDEGKRAAHMGYYNAAMALLGAAISFLAGRFALQGWTHAFRVNWFACLC